MERTWYEVLGADPGSSNEQVEKAYTKLRRKLQSELDGQLSPVDRGVTERMLVQVEKAWDVLGDPARKSAYDNDSGVRAMIESGERWEEPPLPKGFDYWPRRDVFARRMLGMHHAVIGDGIWRSLSLVPLSQDLSSLRELWPSGVWFLSGRAKPITDQQLSHISGMYSMRKLDLSQTRVGDGGMSHLIELDRLNDLRLSGTALTDRGLETIGKLRSLEALELADTQITDAGLEHLCDLVKLDHLDLRGTNIKGPGLVFLHRMSDLDVIFLPRGVGRQQERALKGAIPHLEFR